MTALELSLVIVSLVLATIATIALLYARHLKRSYRDSHNQAPIGHLSQAMPEGEVTISPQARDILKTDKLPSLDALAELFSDDHRDLFEEALADLRTTGEPMGLTLDYADASQTLRLEGRRLGQMVEIWVEDATLLSWLSEVCAEREKQMGFYLGLLNKLPFPIWWRHTEDLKLVGCNEAYAQALDLTPEEVLQSQRQLGAGAIPEHGMALAKRARRAREPQSESHYIVVDGKRRLLDFTECTLGEGDHMTAGFALDVTPLEEVQTTLATHIAAHDQILEMLGSAIAVFGADKRLKFFNEAFLRLWGLDEDYFPDDLTYGELLELLRQRRQLPEIVDFPAFKRDLESRFTHLIEPVEELMHLPDERTLRVICNPHPFGGLLIVYEDVTDRLALERSYNTLIAVQQATLNNLYEGVAVFGSDGRLKVWNKVYAGMWELPEKHLSQNPHVSDLVDYARAELPDTDNWPDLRRRLILAVTEPKPRQRRLERKNGEILDIAHVPLPDGQCLVLYQDVTDSVRVERALAERNAAFERADLLKSQFIANVSYELRTPLNAIQGFTEVLESRVFGDLNERQHSHVQNILRASEVLMGLINDILDLATLQAGFLHLDLQEVEPAQLCADAITSLQSRADDREVELTLTCEEGLGVFMADRNRIGQVVRNIAENLIKFSQHGDLVAVNVNRRNNRLRIEFISSGSEQSEEDQEFLIRRFEGRDSNALQTGAALGLALAKSLVDLHGGALELEVDTETGVTVSCVLPIATSAGDTPRLVEVAADG